VIPEYLSTQNQIGESVFSKEVICDLKQKLCECSKERPQSLHSSQKTNKKYQLPCGNIIEIGAERLFSTEILFDTSLDVESDISEQLSIPDAIVESLNLCDIDLRRELIKNIIVAGGNTNFNNFKSRLASEIHYRTSRKSLWLKQQKENKNSLLSQLPSTLISKVQENSKNSPSVFGNEQDLAVWIGGSIFSSFQTFSGLWVAYEEYDERDFDYLKNRTF
jgi:actin-related protein